MAVPVLPYPRSTIEIVRISWKIFVVLLPTTVVLKSCQETYDNSPLPPHTYRSSSVSISGNLQRRISKMSAVVFRLIAAASLLTFVSSVDRSNFKTCEQSSFCRRCRKMEPGKSVYELDMDSLKHSATSLTVGLVNTDTAVRFVLSLQPLKDDVLRLNIKEETPLRPRFTPPFVLEDYVLSKWKTPSKSANKVELELGSQTVTLHSVPFKLEVAAGGKTFISLNERGLLQYEQTRTKPPERDDSEDPGSWEENFKSHHDSKPHGPTAVALDFTFKGAKFAYGLPEHADSLALKTTTGGDPYRLYNLDVFEYEINNPMALYAAIPLLIAHSEERTTGVFWVNPSETWVDVKVETNNVVSSLVNFVGGNQESAVETHFMSESGDIDVFILPGPKPMDVFRQYTALTGTAPLPPIFSLAFHQSKWDYNSQDDVDALDKAFDEYDIPMDVMWLDIEHTDSKKYFTWDPYKFSDPIAMQHNLTARGRKLVAIVDPHIKRDNSYFLHNDATNLGYYVKNKDNADYEGWCWPGSSSYIDFLNPDSREYFASRYNLKNWQGSTPDLYVWNDMNEPSVFNGPEVTMPKDNIHFGGFEHREVHNLVGLIYTMSTHGGLINRDDSIVKLEDKKRPFVLTRSAFAGSQRFAAIWTGDNMAEWSHLRISYPMCLSLAIAGMSFCGADVGGFFHNPDAELLVRWYQAGAYLPFFRAHAHLDSKRREPWLFGPETTDSIRSVVKARYSFLPLWYTLFYQHNITGDPVIRPLWAEYPEDSNTFNIDDHLLLGNSLLVRPVMGAGETQVSVYFPGADSLWYDIDTYQVYRHGTATVQAGLSKIPVFYRGGSIVPRKLRVRRSSPLMLNDPYTLYVVLDSKGQATGYLYLDDGETFRYRLRQDSSAYMKYKFAENTLSSDFASSHRFDSPSWLERVVIVGLKPDQYKASLLTGETQTSLDVKFDTTTNSLTIRKPAVPIASRWIIKIK
ncbi:neutral alpha-glucosidase AB [Nesidiocoris tenuis]|uniref:Glucosidase II subunit alpha n=1 Tax=Nesidiocoris tenuis TaxID=355587 RepID=A0ABN7AEK2_9HEMI|nr:neutral alpha-glucosidase AB [Nesidiocoris tenuis]